MNCVRGPEAWRPCEQAVVEAEHRHHVVVGVERRAQGRMVVQAQVAPEPDEGGHAAVRTG